MGVVVSSGGAPNLWSRVRIICSTRDCLRVSRSVTSQKMVAKAPPIEDTIIDNMASLFYNWWLIVNLEANRNRRTSILGTVP